MQTRQATLDDRDAIAEVHERSVREIAAEHYCDAVVEARADLTTDQQTADGPEAEEEEKEERPAVLRTPWIRGRSGGDLPVR